MSESDESSERTKTVNKRSEYQSIPKRTKSMGLLDREATPGFNESKSC